MRLVGIIRPQLSDHDGFFFSASKAPVRQNDTGKDSDVNKEDGVSDNNFGGF